MTNFLLPQKYFDHESGFSSARVVVTYSSSAPPKFHGAAVFLDPVDMIARNGRGK